MFWEVGLLVTTLAAAISASIGDEPPQGGSGIGATGAIINKSDPFGGLDTNGVIINETELLTISDEDMDFYSENSIEERKVGKPTTSCKRAGGNCIKGGAKCIGTVDKKNYKCVKKCKCCIPEVCKPTTSCTRAGGSCIKGRAKCDGTVDPKGCKGGRKCKCCKPVITTTTPLTTTLTGTTDNPCGPWITVGSDRFIRLPRNPRTNWFAARKQCQNKCGLDLYEPKNSQNVAVYLEREFRTTDRYWVGARGNSLKQEWLSGGIIPRTSSFWFGNYYLRVGTEYCMEIMTHEGHAGKGEVFAPIECDNNGRSTGVICG